ncbi:MAG: PadR family transcriptional regulator [Candidatus Micrarchaeia archaeon]
MKRSGSEAIKKRHWLGYMSRDMQRAMIKIIIMVKLKEKGEMYAYEILKDMEKIKHPFIKGNPQIKNEVYNTLKSLTEAGYIKEKVKMKERRVKVYYELTDEGASVLKSTRALIRDTARSMSRILS